MNNINKNEYKRLIFIKIINDYINYINCDSSFLLINL